MRNTISRGIFASTYCLRSTNPRRGVCGMTRRRATPRFAGGRSNPWTNRCTRMSELERQIGRFIEELERNNASVHTIMAYQSDLRQFLGYFSPPDVQPPPPSEFEGPKIPEWPGAACEQKRG